MSAAVLKFPAPANDNVPDDPPEYGGGDDKFSLHRMRCPTPGCGSRTMHFEWAVDHDNGRVDDVWLTCANCGATLSTDVAPSPSSKVLSTDDE